jgi:hypothetical protein
VSCTLYEEADTTTKKYHERRLMGPNRRQCEATRDYDVQAVVEGAGGINGRYRWVDLETYERSAMHNGEKVVFTLFSRANTTSETTLRETRSCAPFVGGTFQSSLPAVANQELPEPRLCTNDPHHCGTGISCGRQEQEQKLTVQNQTICLKKRSRKLNKNAGNFWAEAAFPRETIS